MKKLERDVPYHGFYFNPGNAKRYDLGTFVSSGKAGVWLYQIGDRQEFGNFELSRTPFAPAELEASGPLHRVVSDECKMPEVPSPQDWVLVLERVP